MFRERIAAGLFALTLVGCAAQMDLQVPQAPVTNIPVAGAAELVPAPASYYVHGELDAVMSTVGHIFADRGALAYYWIDGEKLRIRSRPLEEPDVENRYRRVIYTVKGEVFPNRLDCVWVEVRWDLYSRGKREVTWRQDDADPAYRPELLDEINNRLSHRRCQ